MGKHHNFEIIAGTYEEFLLGLNFSTKSNTLTQSFASHDHSGLVRCVTTAGHYLASGGADDRICVYDMKARKEHCQLTHHNATITALGFTDNHSHIISASSDGVLAIVRVGNWQLEKMWEKAHKGAAILDLAVHSSGKLALTLGSDCTLCTWNLVKGRQAYKINLYTKCKDPKSLERLAFTPDGTQFVLYGGKFTEIWSLETGGALHQIEHPTEVTSCTWLDDDTLLAGLMDGRFSVIQNGESDLRPAHDGRVKAVAVHKKWIVSACSTGEVKVWNRDFEEIAKHDTGCRLTCLCIIPFVNVKKEQEVEEVVSEVEVRKKSKAPRVIVEESDDDVEVAQEQKRRKVEGGKKKKKNNKSKT